MNPKPLNSVCLGLRQRVGPPELCLINRPAEQEPHLAPEPTKAYFL